MEFAPGGKLIGVQGETGAIMFSALTGKKKFECPAKQFCFAHSFNPSEFTQSDKPDSYKYEYESDLE